MRERGGIRRYKAVASVFTDSANMAAYGAGAAGSITLTDSTFLSLQEMRLAGRVDLVMDRSERNYLPSRSRGVRREDPSPRGAVVAREQAIACDFSRTNASRNIPGNILRRTLPLRA